jgi:hypothetical protein
MTDIQSEDQLCTTLPVPLSPHSLHSPHLLITNLSDFVCFSLRTNSTDPSALQGFHIHPTLSSAETMWPSSLTSCGFIYCCDSICSLSIQHLLFHSFQKWILVSPKWVICTANGVPFLASFAVTFMWLSSGQWNLSGSYWAGLLRSFLEKGQNSGNPVHCP